MAVAAIFLIASAFSTSLYNNYLAMPPLFLVLLIDVAALLCIKVFLNKATWFKAWFSSALTILMCTFFGLIELYPNLFPSNIDKAYSITASSAASSPLTMKIMLLVAAIFLYPL